MAYFAYNHPQDQVGSLADVTISVGTEDTDYPATLVSDFSDAFYAAPSKLTTPSGAWLFDWGVPQRVDLIAVLHNFDSNLADVAWQMNATDVWTSPTVNASLAVPVKRDDGYTLNIGLNVTKSIGYSAGGFQFARLTVPTANSVPIGVKVWIGQIIRIVDRPLERGLHIPDNHAHIDLSTDSLYRWTYDLLGAPRILSGNLSAKISTDDAMRAFWRSCRGRVLKSIVWPDPDINDIWVVRWMAAPSTTVSAGSGYGVGNLNVQLNTPSFHPMSIAFEEASIGSPQWT